MTINNASNDKDYFIFSIATIFLVAIAVAIFSYYSFVQFNKNNYKTLEKESNNINHIVSDSFQQSNRINSFIGNQIANHGSKDLSFILSLFREADKLQNNNSELLSWTSFDWVNNKNLQTVNSRLGIRKNPPDMSARQYIKTSPQNPWHLEVSFPTLGNPSQMWVIPAGTGITNSKKEFLGIIVIGFSVAEFSSKIQQKLGSDISFVVLDRDSNIILQSSDNRLKPIDDFYKNNQVQKQFTKSSGKLNKDILIDGIRYSHYQKMEQYPYIILTGFNQVFLSERFNNLVSPRILEFVVITIFFLMILYLFKTRISILLNMERELTNSLTAAIHAKTNLLKTISHDLRNYIFGIYGLAKIILDKKNEKKINQEEELQFIKTISEQSEEAMHFIEDLLDAEQSETGKFTLGRIEKCDVEELIRRVVLLNKNFADGNKVTIKMEIDNDLPLLKCDVRRMKQILINLISNAIKYSYAHSFITIAAKHLKKQKQIYIEVSDFGIGMNQEEIEMALNGSGAEIDKSLLNKAIDSHGIGMPIVKQLVGLQKGKMEIESEKEKGTKIKLYFEIDNKFEVKEHINNEATIDKKEHNALSDKSILVVEDSPVNAMIVINLLKKSGCKIYHATDGQEALKILDQKSEIDLILMDGEMPIMNGYETTTAIRNGEHFKNFKNYKKIPIIALMSNDDVDTINKSKECGMNAHVGKGSSVSSLLELICSYLK